MCTYVRDELVNGMIMRSGSGTYVGTGGLMKRKWQYQMNIDRGSRFGFPDRQKSREWASKPSSQHWGRCSGQCSFSLQENIHAGEQRQSTG